MLKQLFLTSVLVGITIGQANICPNRKRLCPQFETCVSWERGCSLGANCLEPGIFESFNDCVKPPVEISLLPTKPLCKEDEVFARSVDKRCAKPPCPYRLGYNCYPLIKRPIPTCKNFPCAFGSDCVIGESCTDWSCEAKPVCRHSI